MTIANLLSFISDVVAEYVDSTLYWVVLMPILCFAIVIVGLRVVKYVCTIW